MLRVYNPDEGEEQPVRAAPAAASYTPVEIPEPAREYLQVDYRFGGNEFVAPNKIFDGKKILNALDVMLYLLQSNRDDQDPDLAEIRNIVEKPRNTDRYAVAGGLQEFLLKIAQLVGEKARKAFQDKLYAKDNQGDLGSVDIHLSHR